MPYPDDRLPIHDRAAMFLEGDSATKQPSTQDTYEARLREARAAAATVQQETRNQRLRIAGFHDFVMTAADRWQEIGDSLIDHSRTHNLPDAPVDDTLRPLACPVHAAEIERAFDSFRATTAHAYTIAGHYRRVAGQLEGYLDAVPEDPAADVLELDHDEQLGYLAPSDEWVDGIGQPLNDWLQDAANLMQRAGLLPAFDGCFPASEPTEEPASV